MLTEDIIFEPHGDGPTSTTVGRLDLSWMLIFQQTYFSNN